MSEYDVELDAQGVPLDAKKGKAETEKVRPKGAPAQCPRWMFHRAGEYCKACGKTATK
jgi:hypothetical protein